jgi:hypothetical protein
MAEALVEILVQVQAGGHMVELGQGGAEHGRIEVGFLSHESPFH